MSTRCSIAWHERYHLWFEAMEWEAGVYLQMREPEGAVLNDDMEPVASTPVVFNASPDQVTVRIDHDAFRAMIEAYCAHSSWWPA